MKKILVISLLALLAACSKKEEPATAAPAAAGPGVEQMLSAMMRAHPAIDMICHDPSRDRTFLVRFVQGRFENWEGWYIVERVDFYGLPNGTFFITPIAADRYVKVWPQTDGLKCGSEVEFPHQ